MLLNESDTRAKLIDPALHQRGWTEDLIRREESAGTVYVVAGQPRKQAHGWVDYTLRLSISPGSQPVAVALIEAKAEHHPPAHGLEQAKAYASSKRLHVPFVYSSNGHQFVEFDSSTGLTGNPMPMGSFPTPADLRRRYEELKGFSLDSEAAKPLLSPYNGGESQRRYYQDAAIRAALEKIAAGGVRALLTMATGSGKTFIAAHLLKKFADAGQLVRALFVCDREELRAQGLGALQAVFGADAAAASTANPQLNARVVVATYQTLGVDRDDDDSSFLTTHYPENYFSHIIIDEAHRSAWGKWSEVLTRNSNAVQIGLTATPREFEYPEDTPEAKEDRKVTADNLRYFGEPVYEYSIGQGIEDGYLGRDGGAQERHLPERLPRVGDRHRHPAGRPGRQDPDRRHNRRGSRHRRDAAQVRGQLLRSLPDDSRTSRGDVPEPVRPSPGDGRAGTEDHHLLRQGQPRRKRGNSDEQPLRPVAHRPGAAAGPGLRLQVHRRQRRRRLPARLPGQQRPPFHRHNRGPAHHRRRRAQRQEHRLLPVRQLAHLLLPDGGTRHTPASPDQQAHVPRLRLHRRHAPVRRGLQDGLRSGQARGNGRGRY